MKQREPREHLYTKAIAITLEDLEWIKENRERKSAAGKLHEIIEFYKLNKKL